MLADVTINNLSIPANVYPAVKNVYTFYRGSATRINVPEDIKFFLNDKRFDVKIIEGEKPKPIEIPKPEPKYKRDDLIRMNRKEQEKIADELGIKATGKMREIDIVEAILRKQGE